MKGEGIIYSPQWYDASGKPLDCLTASPPINPSEEPPSDPEDKHTKEVTSLPPVPVDATGDGPDDDAKSKKASSSESESDSGSSGSGSGSGLGSGSGDSSPDSASSHSKSGEGNANSNARSDVVTKRKVRQRRKPHQSNEDSDEETVLKVTAVKTGGHSDEDVKRTLQDHGRLDGTGFIPMVISNLATHRVLAMSQWVAHYHVPLKIMAAPLHTQAGAVKVYMRFVEFLARWVIALQERLGPNTTTVQLESETGGQLISPTHRRSSSVSPGRKSSPPPKRGSPAPSRHGSPQQIVPGKKASAPTGIGKDVFSLQSQSTLQLWADLNLSDQDIDDTFSDEEGKDRHQTLLPVQGKRVHLSSDDEKKSPSKKAKLDISNLYDATPSTSTKGVGATGKGDGATQKGDGDAGKGGDDPESKAHKHKKTKKSKKK